MKSAFPLTAAGVAAACSGRLVAGSAAAPLRSFSIDTRTLRAGDVFIALTGPRFDGNAFVGEAASRGAAAAMVSTANGVEQAQVNGLVTIAVDDTLTALQALATHVRRVSGARVVAVTGSVGKTTTKEAAASLLSGRYRTLRNRGNLNNHIGLPLSLLDLQEGAEVAVVELGMNHAGEISTLVAIAEPDVRVWTNVGTAHLAFFGSIEAISAAKAEVLERAKGDTLFVANADDERVMAHVASFPGKTMTFGIDCPADVQAIEVRDQGVEGQQADVRTPAGVVRLDVRLPGQGHLANVLAAVTVALHFDVPLPEIAERVAALSAAAHRGQVLHLARGVRVLDDCYNSSPTALARSLEVVASTPTAGQKIAVLGEMLELGEAASELHRECGKAAARAGISRLLVVGGTPAQALGDAAREAGMGSDAVLHAGDSEEAATLVAAWVRDGDLVLVKGSRGIQLERVVERLKAEWA